MTSGKPTLPNFRVLTQTSGSKPMSGDLDSFNDRRSIVIRFD